MGQNRKGATAVEQIYPSYYRDFKCIQGACRHNCCIGWEIDIDPDTAAFYDTVEGELGRRLRQNIDRQGEPHFILGEGERCPFLNGDNLCDIILELGEEHICGICTDHPRFRNELPGRVETGLGLCCEEAARLILSWPGPVKLVGAAGACDDDIIALRDEAMCLLQDREKPISHRVEEMLALCGASLPQKTMEQWAEILLSLERLDEDWTARLLQLRERGDHADLAAFDGYMACRQEEYEQLLVYFLYRHLANACDEVDLAARAAFAALGYEIIHRLGAIIWMETGEFSFPQQVELARLFSSEIEYSDENLDILLDELAFG